MDLRPGYDAGRRGAVLARVEVAADLDPFHDLFQVGVVEDDDRCLAAELEVNTLQGRRGRARDLLAGGHIAGERDHRHARVADDSGADRLTVAGDDVENPRRKYIRGQLGELERREGCPLGGLEHHAVAGGKGGRDLPGGHHQRVVPGCDRADDADRLAPQHAREALHVLAGGPAFEEPRGAREEAKAIDDRRDLLGHGRRQRLADVLRLDPRELVATGFDRFGELQQPLAAVAGRAVRPDVVERLAGCGHRAVDVFLSPLRHVRDDLAGRGIDDLLDAVARARRPLATDENVMASQRRAHWVLASLAIQRLLPAPRRECPALLPTAHQEW